MLVMSFIQQVSRMQLLSRIWDSSEAEPPNEMAIELAIRLLRSLEGTSLVPCHVDPSAAEGVSISFGGPGCYAALEASKEGDILAVVSSDHSETTAWIVARSDLKNDFFRNSEIAKAVVRIKRHISG